MVSIGRSPRRITQAAPAAASSPAAAGFPAFPDPAVQNGALVRQPLPASIETSSPQFQAAESACGER